ncbi:hypothetical protein K6745_12070 [Vibrio alginolyticus]|uniref:hypothetical protein n=2 Tax=Vibrio TaxID=662 RepID=UPI001EED6C83|nr:hypothetical protein [Vibrio alginolyticus]ULF67641.1 hypothetical protein K6745_08550 [Vibrio alginolyticus]ULF68298.1 hypothetical protein K6745_12070 [Vibrio alginolyticus]
MAVVLNHTIRDILDSQKKGEASSERLNNLYDTEFIVGDSHLDVSFSGTQLSSESKVVLRYAIVQALGGYLEAGVLSAERLYVFERLEYFCEYLNAHNIVHILDEFNFEHVVGYLYFLIDKRPENGQEIYAHQSIITLMKFLNDFSKLAIDGSCVWATTATLSRSKLSKVASEYISDKYPDVDVLEWLYGGSLETVSLSTAMLMLNYSIEQLESIEHKVIQAYFDVCRGEGGCNWWINANKKLAGAAALIVEHGHDDFEAMEYVKSSNAPSILSRLRNMTPNFYRWFDKVNARLTDKLSLPSFISIVQVVVPSQAVLSEKVRHYHNCSLTVIAILTGIRVHELANIKANNAIKEESGVVYLTTRIDKTHQGLPVTRSTGDAVSIAVDSLLELSYIDKTQPLKYKVNGVIKEGYCSIFYNAATYAARRYHTQPDKLVNDLKAAWLGVPDSQVKKEARNGTLNRFINDIYEKTLKSLSPETEKEIRDLDENISVHAFRHTFVDFLLRRFDGDVYRAIRRCFAHSSKDVMNYVDNYIRNKVSPQVQSIAERAYTHELIKKIAGDINHTQFTGASVEYVRKKLSTMSWVTMDELDEKIYDWISSDGDGLVRLVPHSYGFCMLFKDRVPLAKCRDFSGVAKVERGESNLCLGCSNVAVKSDSHLTTLEQLQTIHMNLLESSKKPNNLMSLVNSNKCRQRQESQRIIKTIDALRSQLNELEVAK